MKAAVYRQYGPPDVVEVVQVDRPTPQTKNEVLIKVHATTVTTGDVRLRASDFPAAVWLPARCIFGLVRPKKQILGHEFAGVVEAVGANVTKFRVGDQVFGTTTMCPTGAHAEYVCLPQQWKLGVLETKPVGVSFADAAALPIGAMTAMYLLMDKAKLKSSPAAPSNNNCSVLIYGASGSVGSFAIQLAVAEGATVTAVCSAKNADMVRSLGAKHVIDYHDTDYSDDENAKYDIVLDAVGKTSKQKANKVLKNGGRFVSVEMLTDEKSSHLLKIRQMAEQGKLKPFIDKRYTLDRIKEAHEYVDSGRKRGNVVIEIIAP